MTKKSEIAIKYLFIELTNNCNFSCSFCPDARMKRKRAVLDRKTVQNILKEAGEKWITNEPVQFHLMGEPLLVKDLFDHIDYAHSQSLKVRLFTNGALLSEQVVRRLYDMRLEELVIGVQTWGSESFQANRNARISYDSYMKIVKDAVVAKFIHKAPTRISIHYLNTKPMNAIRTKQGYKPLFLPDLVDTDEKALTIIQEWVEFGKSVCVKMGLSFKARELECLTGEYREKPLDCLFGDHAEILPDVIIGFKAISTFSDWLMKGVRYVEKHKGFCPSVFEQFAVLSDGSCTLCCVDYEGAMSVGDIRKGGLIKLWRGKAARKAREMMQNDLYPHRLCRICKAYTVPDDYSLGFGETDRNITLVNGFYSLETEGDKPFRWTGKTARIRVSGASSRLRFEVKSGFDDFDTLTLLVRQGKHERSYELPPSRWTKIEFPLKKTGKYGHDIELETDSLFIPAEENGDPRDTRELAMMCAGILGLP